MTGHVLALAGGVGGAKLALGLTKILSPEKLTIVVNTGDDEVFHGLHVSPDLDTMMYALAGLTNNFRGETARKFVVVSLSLFNRATIVIYKLNW